MRFGTVVNTTWWATCFEWWPAGPSSVTCGTCPPWPERYCIDKRIFISSDEGEKTFTCTCGCLLSSNQLNLDFLPSRQMSHLTKMYLALFKITLVLDQETLFHNSFYHCYWFIEPTDTVECCILHKSSKEHNKYMYVIKILNKKSTAFSWWNKWYLL